MESWQATRRAFLKTAGSAVLMGLSGSLVCKRQAGTPDAAAPVPGDGSTSQDQAASELLKTPEALFRPTPSGVVVQWVPRGTVDARVLAGLIPGQLALVRELTSEAPVAVAVDAFEPGSKLCLQCQFRRRGTSAWRSRPLRELQTARLPGEAYSVAMIADSHVYSAPRVPQRMRNIARTNAAIIADKPDFAIFLGDESGVHFLRDEPGYMSQERALERWQHWRGAFAPLLASVPSYMVLGNHEGEAGFYQRYPGPAGTGYYQRWGTVARKRYFLNPLPDTYPERGEQEGWFGDPDSPATAGATAGNCSPLQNYYAWTWGDALFAVVDVHRYTNVGGPTPTSVDQWTLGPAQLRWLEGVLLQSQARWKIVVAHHLVGGYAWDREGRTWHTDYVYGRGGARYARVGEQRRITEMMKRAGAQFFFYGHDHVFAHQQADDIHFVCCGRPTFLQTRWWATPGWKEAYGDANARNPHDFYAAIGYVRLTISPGQFRFEYWRTGTDPNRNENVAQAEGKAVYSFSVRA